MQSYKLKPDIHFFNVMIKKYIFWNQETEAHKILRVLPKYDLSPNIMTWGVLCLGCSTWESASNLLSEMDQARFK